MVYTVALTGGIGSGKSTVAEAFSRAGVTVIDADVIARQVVAPGQCALALISQHFGPPILQKNGTLNRRALREAIFSSPRQQQWVNNLLHPLIQRQTSDEIARATSPYVLWVVPLLVENNLQQKANRILVVDVSPETQIARTILRDNVSREHAQQILASQASREARLAVADDIINNDGKPQDVAAHVDRLHHQYLKLAAQAAQQETE